jgi:thiamine pyrophosphokinase
VAVVPPDPPRTDEHPPVGPVARPDARGLARVVVLAGGDPLPPALDTDVADAIDGAELTIAADGGIRHAHRAGRDPHVLVGDLDSVTPEDLARARTAGTEVLRHPVDKDATDLELALDVALARTAVGPRTATPVDSAGSDDGRVPGHRPGLVHELVDELVHEPVPVLVVGGHGGRSDHLIANVLLLTAERYARLRLTAWWGTDVLHVVRDSALLHGRVGSTVTLLAVHAPARGVTTVGLHFPLDDADLEPGSTLGVSNRLVTSPASVHVREGVLAVLHSPPA